MSGDARGLDESTSAGRRAETVGGWLSSLHPAPPPALGARIAELLDPSVHMPADGVPEVCLEAGERLLSELLTSGSTEQPTALDLLAVDALVTYAFQAAADAPTRIESRAALAMQRISALPHADSARSQQA